MIVEIYHLFDPSAVTAIDMCCAAILILGRIWAPATGPCVAGNIRVAAMLVITSEKLDSCPVLASYFVCANCQLYFNSHKTTATTALTAAVNWKFALAKNNATIWTAGGPMCAV